MSSFKKMALKPLEEQKSIISPTEKKYSTLESHLMEILNSNLPTDQKLKMYYTVLERFSNIHSKIFPVTSAKQQQLPPAANMPPTVPSWQPLGVPPELPTYDTTTSSFSLLDPRDYVAAIGRSRNQNIAANEREGTPGYLTPPNHLQSDSPIHPIVQGRYNTSSPVPSLDGMEVEQVVRDMTKHPDIVNFDPRNGKLIYKGKPVEGSNIVDLISHHAYPTANNIPGYDLFNSALTEVRNMDAETGVKEVYPQLPVKYQPSRVVKKKRRVVANGPSTRSRNGEKRKQDRSSMLANTKRKKPNPRKRPSSLAIPSRQLRRVQHEEQASPRRRVQYEEQPSPRRQYEEQPSPRRRVQYEEQPSPRRQYEEQPSPKRRIRFEEQPSPRRRNEEQPFPNQWERLDDDEFVQRALVCKNIYKKRKADDLLRKKTSMV